MEHLPALISDLALILIAAGVVGIVFKRLRQPLVLGYIVAGFLAGPHMPYMPSVEDPGSISTWSEIGVIFLMFTLGLEFSFKKIIKMGLSPVIAACTIMFCMISVGSGVGQLFGWSSMDSLFLGGMLAMSSTTIIYKAFDDLGLRQQKFAGEVLSVLILEDILGILLMVILSAMAVSRKFEGAELGASLLKLAFCLILWFTVGVYVVPTLLRKAGKWINRETMLVVALGMCFLMVVIAAHAGYSAAFGAFMMGSILAETVEAENIERVVSPVKDLFGAIFFVSVGMLVDPGVLREYWLPVCAITAAILLGQVFLGTGSFLLSGQPLRTAMRCGFSMAQIGEFAFIIASLGVGLGVTSDFLYPVVVAVSIITTFLTPYMIRAAVPAHALAERLMPAGVLGKLDRRGGRGKTETPSGTWSKLLKALAGQVGAYTTLSIAAVGLSLGVLLPLCRTLTGHWAGNIVCGLFTLAAVSPFLRAIVMRKNHSAEFRLLRARSRLDRAGLAFTLGLRFALAVAVVYYVFDFLSPLHWGVHIGAGIAAVALMISSRRVKFVSIRMERTFLQNLRSREVKAAAGNGNRPRYAVRLASHNVHLAQLDLPEGSLWGGKTLRELNLGKTEGVMIAAILRGGRRLNIPDGDTRLFPGDRIEVIGDDTGLTRLAQRMDVETRTFEADATRRLWLRRLVVAPESEFCERPLSRSGIRDTYHCMAVGFEDESDTLDLAVSDRIIRAGDTLWVVGEEDSLARIMAAARGHVPPAPSAKE